MMKHNSVAALKSIPPTRRILSAISTVLALGLALGAFGSPVTTAWTYQGQLRRSGAAYNGTCNFQFSLWDAASAGTQKTNILSINSVDVVNGLFTVTLDFGEGPSGLGYPFFSGEARWLGTSVQCSGDGGFTPLDPRQPITAAPYALSLRPGATIVAGFGSTLSLYQSGQSPGASALEARNDGPGNAIYAYGSGIGVFGGTGNGTGVFGRSQGTGSAIYGETLGNGLAGRFIGNVTIEGSLFVNGPVFKSGGTFRIDHPLDPANKFLSHSFVESPDMMNIYNGNVTTDAAGGATVTLPDYFEALNRDYRYQLTVLGQFAQAIVSRKIAGNTFEIGTDKPGVEVSWQVTGIRQDAYARANPVVVEEAKPAEEQGLYLYPAGFGAGQEKQIGFSSRPATPPGAQEPAGRGPADQAPRK